MGLEEMCAFGDHHFVGLPLRKHSLCTKCGATHEHIWLAQTGNPPPENDRGREVAIGHERTARERTDALCNFCGEPCVGDVGGVSEAMGLIDARVLGGYASTPGNGQGALDDGTVYTFSLCEFCLDWLFARFKTPPVVTDYNDNPMMPFRPAEVRVSEDSWRKQKQKFFDEAARRSVAARGHPDRTDEKLFVETFKGQVLRMLAREGYSESLVIKLVEEIPWSTCYVPLEPIPLTDAERAFAENIGKVLAARERELVPGFFTPEKVQIPSVGRLVHYFGKLSKNDYPEPDDGPFAALVIDVTSKDVVTLEVTGRTGQKYIRAGVPYSEAMDMGTWCWPVRT